MATSHFRTTALPEKTLPLGAGIGGWTAKRGQTLLLPNLIADPRAQAYPWLSRDAMSSALCTPLKMGKETVGVLEVYTQEMRTFVKEEAEILASFARRAGVAETLRVGK
jgi:GAF domain-containing protein